MCLVWPNPICEPGKLLEMDDIPRKIPPGSLLYSRQRGFALVTVIWGLGLILLLGGTLVVGAKYRSKIASAGTSVARASAAAESAINLAIAATLMPEGRTRFPLQCRMPGGERAFVTVEEEIGKVDLNAASKPILERLFAALASDKALGERIAGEILRARSTVPSTTPRLGTEAGIPPPSTTNGKQGPRPGFASIMELDQMAGMSPGLFRKALPFVTVASGRTAPAGEAASPALIEALGLSPPPAQPRRILASGNVTIRADVTLSDGSRQVREALIDFEGGAGLPYAIREWRLGTATLSPTQQRRLPPCVRI